MSVLELDTKDGELFDYCSAGVTLYEFEDFLSNTAFIDYEAMISTIIVLLESIREMLFFYDRPSTKLPSKID